NRPWTLEEIAAAREAAPPHIRLPFEIGLSTGMREGDVITLRRDSLNVLAVKIVTAKRSVPIDLPFSVEMLEAAAAQHEHDAITLCASTKGTPWTESGFLSAWGKFKGTLQAEGKLGPNCTFHGLRHTVANMLAEEGVSAEDISSILGHKDSKMA